MIDEQVLIQATAGRAHFSAYNLAVQVAWDSTSMSDFKTCPRKYYYSHVLGLRSKREALPLSFGIYYHFGLEYYDHLRAAGADHDEATKGTVQATAAKMSIYKKDDEGKLVLDEFDKPIFLSPWLTDDTKRNMFTCLRSIVWYLDQYKEDTLQTVHLENGKPAVELSFRMQMPGGPSPDGTPYILCGHLDRVVDFKGLGLFIADRKTTVSAISSDYYHRYSPDHQMSQYTIAGKVVFNLPTKGVLIDAAQVAVGFTRFHRGFVNRTPAQLEEWLHDMQYWTGLAVQCAQLRYWPQNDKACHMYNGCNYRGVCSRDPSVRHSYLADEFALNPWNPLESRGNPKESAE